MSPRGVTVYACDNLALESFVLVFAKQPFPVAWIFSSTGTSAMLSSITAYALQLTLHLDNEMTPCITAGSQDFLL